tara:strand:+ start:219 stop:533 length:315 start_codon:yes stop_codon:yes gene_type:complete
MKAWLKGGLIGAIIAFVLLISLWIIAIQSQKCFMLPRSLLFPLFTGCSPSMDIYSILISIIYFLIPMVIFYLLGALIGWIIGKIKAKKQIDGLRHLSQPQVQTK